MTHGNIALLSRAHLAEPEIDLLAHLVGNITKSLVDLVRSIETLLDVIDEHWISGTAVLVTAIAIYQWRRRSSLSRTP